ncbi:MAG: hypothetical protein V2I41_20860 [Pseudomonadales bacterium]|jgi:hypothetical protein|nr:hypothetical protein [Pseudomonadales bacterium]
MIRSINKHIREQNWIGLILDFIVVVLGIFLGLQASDWNQGRLDRKEADYHINFLFEELTEGINKAADEIKTSQEVLGGSFTATMLLTQKTWDLGERERFEEAISSTYQLWGPRYRPVSLRRIVDDGKLDLIESKELQKAILRFDSSYREAIEQTKTSYSYSQIHSPKITTSMRFEGPKIVSTTKELLGNPVLRAAVRDKAIWQRIQIDVLNDLQDARTKIRDILTEHGAEATISSSR